MTLKEKIERCRELDVLIPELKKEQERLRAEVIEHLEDSGCRNFSTDSGITATLLEPTIYVSYRKEDESEVFSWLRANGRGDIIKDDPSVHSGTLRATVREMQEQGIQLHDALKVSPKARVRIGGKQKEA